MIDLDRLAQARFALRFQKPPSAPAQPSVSDAIVAAVVALRGLEACPICGGASWVARHDDGCPLDALDQMITTQTCYACRQDFVGMVLSGTLVRSDECAKCFMVSSRGVTYMERMLALIVNKLKQNDTPLLRKQANAVLRMIKRARG